MDSKPSARRRSEVSGINVIRSTATGAAGIALLTLAWTSTGCSRPVPPTAAPVQTAGGMRATLATVPTPPHTGDDVLVVTLTDAITNVPVGDANLTATAEALSPRLPGSPVSGRAQGNGVFQIPVRLPIASSYRVTIQVKRIGRPAVPLVFPLDVSQ